MSPKSCLLRVFDRLSRGSVWKMMSARAVGRTAKVAITFQVANEPAPNVAKPVPAVDRLELRIRQLEDFRVLLLHVLHCSPLLFRSGGPFRVDGGHSPHARWDAAT